VRPFELGIQFTGVHLHKLHETPYGIGLRVFYHIAPAMALDAEVDRYTDRTAGLLGLKTGSRRESFGVFSKVRTGWMNSVPMLDLGGVMEYYPSPRTTIRIDVGDTIIFYGPERSRGTVHNFQPAIGFSFRL
jgi:hypothetical protein